VIWFKSEKKFKKLMEELKDGMNIKHSMFPEIKRNHIEVVQLAGEENVNKIVAFYKVNLLPRNKTVTLLVLLGISYDFMVTIFSHSMRTTLIVSAKYDQFTRIILIVSAKYYQFTRTTLIVSAKYCQFLLQKLESGGFRRQAASRTKAVVNMLWTPAEAIKKFFGASSGQSQEFGEHEDEIQVSRDIRFRLNM